MFECSLYKLQFNDIWYIEKWYNSIKMVKEMGDINNLSKDRYQKLNVYERIGAKVVFKDYEIML